MEDLRKEESEEQLRDFSTDDAPFGISDKGTGDNLTTGSGYSEEERVANDATNTDFPDEKHKGSRELIDKYNINDQAHSDSSKDDFIKTVSNATHADGSTNKGDEQAI